MEKMARALGQPSEQPALPPGRPTYHAPLPTSAGTLKFCQVSRELRALTPAWATVRRSRHRPILPDLQAATHVPPSGAGSHSGASLEGLLHLQVAAVTALK